MAPAPMRMSMNKLGKGKAKMAVSERKMAAMETVEPDGPIRMCVMCRLRFPKASLLRHVRGPNGKMLADEAQILPGRGYYVCADEKCRARIARYRPGLKKFLRKNRWNKKGK